MLYGIVLENTNFFLKGVATNKQKRVNKPNFKLIYLKTNLVKSEKCENKRKYLTWKTRDNWLQHKPDLVYNQSKYQQFWVREREQFIIKNIYVRIELKWRIYHKLVVHVYEFQAYLRYEPTCSEILRECITAPSSLNDLHTKLSLAK